MLAGFYYVGDDNAIWRIHDAKDGYALVQVLGTENVEEFDLIALSRLVDEEAAVFKSPEAAKAFIAKEAA